MGSFIISLDCEGKWGMADNLQPYHHQMLTDRALAKAYERLVALFARYEIPATFAFVMAFTLTADQRRDFGLLVDPDRAEGDAWMAHFWTDIQAGRTEGWFQPDALDLVQADGRHEIACHGFCHRPMDDQSLSSALAQAELEAAGKVASLKGVNLKTLVFPRNQVGNLDSLRGAGYIGFREKLARPKGLAGRLVRLTEEYHVRPSLQKSKKAGPNGLTRIAPGYFFNWRFGARSHVPEGITFARWKSLLDRSARSGTAAHLWLHPHNLITAPSTGSSLERVLAYAAKLRDQGRLTVRTQVDHCKEVEAAA